MLAWKATKPFFNEKLHFRHDFEKSVPRREDLYVNFWMLSIQRWTRFLPFSKKEIKTKNEELEESSVTKYLNKSIYKPLFHHYRAPVSKHKFQNNEEDEEENQETSFLQFGWLWLMSPATFGALFRVFKSCRERVWA